MQIVSLTDRPDLAGSFGEIPNNWPAFMQQSPVAARCFGPLLRNFPELQFLILDSNGTPIGRLHAVPIPWQGADALPDRGWDAAMEGALGLAEPTPAVSLIEAMIDPAHNGRGLSSQLLQAVRERASGLGYRHLVGPVRPSQKSVEPRTPMAEYVARRRPDGLPADAWLRVHVRLGADIVRICPLSMIIPGTVEQWRSWTGLPFAASGEVEVPGALTPVHVDRDHDHVVYVEPNVWMHHRLS
ncbi:GNAT family N-acetyltransferase [Microlunatus soli]|uniref:N-acetyltransferase domain-containing protein n=1 Tax=Microlunatus soli TaxID=630515 RepID=A0A1H1VD99_9ACTN|nr:GNAT family N-acetyltransferase [Microlunatus soli]SDS82715.1 hypothetical protein SAMN04489812_3164 [Microlunatus soli]